MTARDGDAPLVSRRSDVQGIEILREWKVVAYVRVEWTSSWGWVGGLRRSSCWSFVQGCWRGTNHWSRDPRGRVEAGGRVLIRLLQWRRWSAGHFGSCRRVGGC